MKRFILFLLLPLLITCKKKNTEQPVDITAVLSKGVNLSNWFNDYSDPGQFGSRFPKPTLQMIRSKGFTYVRIPIGPNILYNDTDPSQLNTTNLTLVNSAVANCIDAGLAVTLNLHPLLNNFDSLLSHDNSFVLKVAAYWKAMAAYFKKYPSDKLFFEVYNEPHASAAGLTPQGFSWWQSVQEKMIASIRETTQEHYIITGGEGWNSISGLLQVQPYHDDKVIYNFHFYDPFLFTHQGASWAGWQPAIDAAGVPYPSSPAALSPLIAATSNTELKNALQWYGDQRYNIDSLDAWVKKAYDWGSQHQVKVIVNEFGSYQPFAPRQSRLNWIHDARTVFEKYKLGWAMWECDEGFGWISYNGGNRNSPIADQELLVALGLQ
ncbi:MAG: cellulase family glycosylhydrolase [Terrimonas sp.]|nr:cellulase family glycosylhydrolase [Terrimonas sp.]